MSYDDDCGDRNLSTVFTVQVSGLTNDVDSVVYTFYFSHSDPIANALRVIVGEDEIHNIIILNTYDIIILFTGDKR